MVSLRRRAARSASPDPGDAQFYLPPSEYLLVVEGFADDEGEYVVEMRCL